MFRSNINVAVLKFSSFLSPVVLCIYCCFNARIASEEHSQATIIAEIRHLLDSSPFFVSLQSIDVQRHSVLTP